MSTAEDIGRLERELRELIVKYEQYFFGIEKREPLRLLENVERLAKRYQNVSIPNTMQRFKYDSLVASLSVHRQKWTRINRLIEEGKYERDRFKMSLHQQPAPKELRSAPAAPAPDPQLERVFQEYCSARLACNLPIGNVSREKIAQVIEQKMPTLQEKYGCSEVELFVVVEQGKPHLKARQKKS
jgi:hypothetical protein